MSSDGYTHTRTIFHTKLLRLTAFGPTGIGGFRSYQLLFLPGRTALTLKLEAWRRPRHGRQAGLYPLKAYVQSLPAFLNELTTIHFGGERRCQAIHDSRMGDPGLVQCEFPLGHRGPHFAETANHFSIWSLGERAR